MMLWNWILHWLRFIADLAATHIDAVAAGIYSTNGPDAVAHIVEDCGATVIIAENAKQLEKFDQNKLKNIKVIVVLIQAKKLMWFWCCIWDYTMNN